MRTLVFITALVGCSGFCPAQVIFQVPGFAPETAQISPAEQKQIFQSFCPGSEFIGEESGCHGCPAQASGGNEDLLLTSFLRGHFLNPDSDDLLVQTHNCESHVSLFGGEAIFSKGPAGWVVTRKYHPGPSGYCRIVRNRAGLDGVLCWQEDSHYDSHEGWLSFSYKDGSDREDTEEKPPLLEIFDNMNGICSEANQGLEPIAVQTNILKLSLARAASGRLILSVRARCRRGRMGPGGEAACKAPDLEPFALIRPAAAWRVFNFVYYFDGRTFRLMPSTKAEAHAFSSCSEDPRRSKVARYR